jgi:hypothetical protein
MEPGQSHLFADGCVGGTVDSAPIPVKALPRRHYLEQAPETCEGFLVSRFSFPVVRLLACSPPICSPIPNIACPPLRDWNVRAVDSARIVDTVRAFASDTFSNAADKGDSMAREVPSRQRLTTAVSRRAVVTTGVKLAYAAPVVAASLQLDALGARALDSSCTDPGLDPNLSWTFDPKFGPPGAPDTVPGFAACCGCPPDATFSYYPDFNYCCPGVPLPARIRHCFVGTRAPGSSAASCPRSASPSRSRTPSLHSRHRSPDPATLASQQASTPAGPPSCAPPRPGSAPADPCCSPARLLLNLAPPRPKHTYLPGQNYAHAPHARCL